MRRFTLAAAAAALALSLVSASAVSAQTRNSSGSSTRSSSSSATRSSSSATRSSSSASQDNRRSSSSATRSSSSASRSSSSASQDNRRSSSSGSATRSSSSATRSSSGSATRSASGSATRSSSSATRSSSGSSATRSSSTGSTASGSATRESASAQQRSTAGAARATNISRSGLSATPQENKQDANGGNSGAYRDESYNYRYSNDFRLDDHHNLQRIPPRHRDPMPWDRPGHFWGDHPHYYGYRIHSIPPHWRRISHWGITYYYYNGIYYRPFGTSYVVCRPPFGTPLEAAIDRAFLRAVTFAYYCDTYRTYNAVFDYYNSIARQNLQIAQQNARNAARYSSYALNSGRALTAYELANRLGLVQSYAYAGSEYFYQDGVFYTISPSGAYSTIIPPAGALVVSLPDDYEIIVMNGIEYYLVDNTVYRTTVFEGQPYLEVLGQMYGSLYNQYNIYR